MSLDGKNVLIVEDDADVRKLLHQTLVRQGAKVFEADSGARALRIIQQEVDIDLLLADDILPGGLTGCALLDYFSELGCKKKPRTLLISGSPPHQFPCSGEGAPYLQKPFTTAELLKKIEELFQEQG